MIWRESLNYWPAIQSALKDKSDRSQDVFGELKKKKNFCGRVALYSVFQWQLNLAYVYRNVLSIWTLNVSGNGINICKLKLCFSSPCSFATAARDRWSQAAQIRLFFFFSWWVNLNGRLFVLGTHEHEWRCEAIFVCGFKSDSQSDLGSNWIV